VIKLSISPLVISRYLSAIFAVALFTAGLYSLRNVLNDPVVALLYLLPVVLSATFWGLGPGITAALCAFLTFNYFFIEPYYSFRVHQTPDLLALLVFLVVTIITSQLMGRVKASLAEGRISQNFRIAPPPRPSPSGGEKGGREDVRGACKFSERIAISTESGYNLASLTP
jgi:two-component system sensor histidine kinase KdpD